MQQATITAAQNGDRQAIEAVLLEVDILSKGFARNYVPRHNRHQWFDYEDVAQLANQIFWETMLATVTADNLRTAVYLTVRTANFKLNREASARKRTATSGRILSLAEHSTATKTDHIQAADDADAVEFLRSQFPSCSEAIDTRLSAASLDKIQAGRWKRMKQRAQELNLAEACV